MYSWGWGQQISSYKRKGMTDIPMIATRSLWSHQPGYSAAASSQTTPCPYQWDSGFCTVQARLSLPSSEAIALGSPYAQYFSQPGSAS